MTYTFYLKPTTHRDHLREFDEESKQFFRDLWHNKTIELGSIPDEGFWVSFWKGSGLISIENWSGAPIEKLTEGTLRVEQVLPSILSKGTKAFDMGRDWHFDAVKKGGFLPEYEEYLNNSATHPFSAWEIFIDKVIHECKTHPDWYIYLN